MQLQERTLPDCPEERCLKGLAWYDNLTQREAAARKSGGYQSTLPQATRDALASIDDPIRRARVTAALLRMELIKGYWSDPQHYDEERQMYGIAAKTSGHGRPFKRLWLYDSGCSRNSIGMPNLTTEEKADLQDIPPISFSTANGDAICRHKVDLNIPHLGRRSFYVLPTDCSPLCSVYEDVTDYGNIFVSDEHGPHIELRNGKSKYLQPEQGPDGTPMIPDGQLRDIDKATATH